MGDDITKLAISLRVVVADGEKNILLNMADISYSDSSGLGEFVAGYNSLQKSGGKLTLLHLTDRVSDLMMITNLLTIFELFDDETEAVNSFQTSPENTGTRASELVTGKLDRALVNQ